MRFFIPALVFASYFLVISTLPVMFGLGTVPFTMLPLAAVYSVVNQEEINGFALVFLTGLIVDSYASQFLGFYTILALIIWLFSRLFTHWFGRLDTVVQFCTIVCASLLFRILSYFGMLIVSAHLFAPSFLNWLWAPLIDGLIGVKIFSLINILLVKFKLAEASLNISERLASHRMRSRGR